jgi:SNF2 family DNA or RNA helicase
MLKPSTKLLEHQEVAVDFFERRKYVLCADDMGLGKSLESLAFAVKNRKPYGRIIICAPAFLKYNWNNEFSKFTEGLVVTVVNGLKDIPSALFSDIIIMNYARLEMCAQLFAICDTVIADESHYLKNPEAKRTAFFHEFIKMYKPENLILLTGTPIENRVHELFSTLQLLSYCPTDSNGKKVTDKFKDEMEFARYFSHESIIQFKQFSPRFKRMVNVKKSVFKGVKNVEELKALMTGKYIRRETDDVITLPEMKESTVMVQYKSKDTKLRDEWNIFTASGQSFEDVKDSTKDVLASLKRKSAIAKAPFTADIAKSCHLDTGEQIVIFSDHITSTEMIAEKLKVPCITGSTPVKKRDQIVQRFTNGDFPYFVATIGSACTGLNLVTAPYLYFNDPSYKPSNNAQAKKRVHRIGQTKDVFIRHVVGSVIDEKITSSLQEKEAVIKKVI